MLAIIYLFSWFAAGDDTDQQLGSDDEEDHVAMREESPEPVYILRSGSPLISPKVIECEDWSKKVKIESVVGSDVVDGKRKKYFEIYYCFPVGLLVE